MTEAQAQQETSLSHLLFGPPLTARVDPAEACAELDLALTTARAQLKAVFGPEENESANQVELETAAVSKLPRDAHGLIARRAMLLFAFREPEVAAAFDCELARDLQTRVLPFFAIIVGILYVLYGGVATPSEAAGVGALFCLVLVVVIYRMFRAGPIVAMFRDTIRESVMIMMIIGASELFAFTLSSTFVTQSIAGWIADLDVNRWVLMAIINVFLLIAGFFLPPVAVILMTAPILLPIITQAGFDPYWFAVVLTINMEIGLITPPVGLNLYVINGIAPDVPLQTILRGSLPYVGCMVAAIVILCFFPGIATWLPTALMGPGL